jgi:predicted DNA-binding transcriptional regulator YafY
MIEYFVKKSLEENKMIRIVYNNKNMITERDIRVLGIKGNRISAYCYLRNSKRTFLMENILAAEFTKIEDMI